MAKALQTFVRTNPAFTIKVGLVEGKVIEPAELRALADLPSKEAIRAQVVGALQGPLTQLVALLTAPQSELVRVLEARSKEVLGAGVTDDNTGTLQEAIGHGG